MALAGNSARRDRAARVVRAKLAGLDEGKSYRVAPPASLQTDRAKDPTFTEIEASFPPPGMYFTVF